MNSFLKTLYKLLMSILVFPFALAGGIICAIFYPFTLITEIMMDIWEETDE